MFLFPILTGGSPESSSNNQPQRSGSQTSGFCSFPNSGLLPFSFTSTERGVYVPSLTIRGSGGFWEVGGTDQESGLLGSRSNSSTNSLRGLLQDISSLFPASSSVKLRQQYPCLTVGVLGRLINDLATYFALLEHPLSWQLFAYPGCLLLQSFPTSMAH